MSATNFTTASLTGLYNETTSTDAKVALGTIAYGTNSTVWIYVKAGAAITQYQWVTIDSAFNALAGTDTNANLGYRIGFAQIAFASADYGWVALSGMIKVYALSGVTSNAALYTSPTTGTLATVTSGTTKIKGIVLSATAGTASGTSNTTNAIATYPFTDL